MKKFLKNMSAVALTVALGLAVAVGVNVQAEAAVVWGDLNGDSVDNASDALIVLQHAAKLNVLADEDAKPGDVNGDGKLDAQDALLILQKAAKIIDKYPVEDIATETPAATEKPVLTPIPTRPPSTPAPIVYPTMIPLPEVSADPANFVEGEALTMVNLNGATEADGIYTFTDDNAAAEKGIVFANPFAGKDELNESLEKALEGQPFDLTDDQKTNYDPEATYRKPVWSTGASLSFWAKYEWSGDYYSPSHPILVIHNSKKENSDCFAIKLGLNGEVKYEAGDDPSNSFRAEGFVMGNYNEWNYYTITFANDFITVYVNGQECAYQSIDITKGMTSAFNAGYMTKYNTPGPISEELFLSDIRGYYTTSGVYVNGETENEATLVDNGVYDTTGYGFDTRLLMSYITDEDAEILLGGCYTIKVNSKALGNCEYSLKSGTQVSGFKAYYSELTPEQVAAIYDAEAGEFLK